MHSVLRPPQTPSDGELRAEKIRKSGPRPLKLNLGKVAVVALGLWLLGGVAWWQYQWWQPSLNESVEVKSLPAQRIANEGRLELR